MEKEHRLVECEPDDGESRLLRKFGTYTSDYTVTRSRRMDIGHYVIEVCRLEPQRRY